MELQTLQIKVRRLVEKLKKMFSSYFGRKKTTYVWDRVSYYKDIWQRAANDEKLQFVALADDVWELRNSENRCVTRINNCYVELDDPVTLHIAGDKVLTYSLLAEAGIAVAPHATFTLDSLHLLREFIDTQSGPFVIKPASGTGSGIGVTTHIDGYSKCVKAAVLASLYCKTILVEQFIPGEVYRLLFVNGELVSAVRRTGLRLEGDGKSSIAQLVSAQHPEIASSWPNDLDLQATIRTQGFTESTIPPAGDRPLIKSVTESYRDNIEIRTVYTEDVTEELCSDIVEDARRTSQVLRSEFCGVDLILLDPQKPLRDGNGVVGEVNTTPGLHHHYKLSGSNTRPDAAVVVLRHILRSR